MSPSRVHARDGVPLPYTASPLRLFWSDVFLFLRYIKYFPDVVLPLTPWNSGALDELYPSGKNLFDIAVHSVLLVFQTVFLLSLPLCVVFLIPAFWIMLYALAVLLVNCTICRFALNGSKRFLVSKVPVSEDHRQEHWIFINGIAVGHHWLQNELDRLAYTFGRRVTGIHNRTSGLVFDIIECVIQRCFGYATPDIRDAYPVIKKSLLDPDYHKVVLILHSQGAIEGGLIIDWLLDELPQETLRNLEVYTFGNAANHFNNPHRSLSHFVRSLLPPRQARHAERDSRCIPHIEHYANSDDYVCLTGVLNFARIPNRYMGRLFVRPGSGHQFNQHYLDTMFTMGRDRRVLGHNNFMDSPVTKENCPEDDGILRECFSNVGRTCRAVFDGDHCLGDKSNAHPQKLIRVKDLSRLWWYRNGGSPLA